MNQFKYVLTYRFRHLNSETVSKMSLRQFLSKAEHSVGAVKSTVLQDIVDNPESVLFIFDGFDEYKHHENVMKDQSEFMGSNDCDDAIPVTALYAKLLQKEHLSGATILTTSRPNAVCALKMFHFDRVAEILGFTPEKVKSYVDKFCKDDRDTASRIWHHIESNINLLYLCYIPVTCRIICSLLEDCIKMQCADFLPITLTDVYKGALRLFLFKHNPEYRQTTSTDYYTNDAFSESIEKALSKLGLLAKNGIEKRQLVFEIKEVQGLENFGLFNCMPSEVKSSFGHTPASQYCFIHLTLQEFLAAREIVTKPNCDIVQFIKSKASDAKWHLVVQFIAGLLQDKQADLFVECFLNLLYDSVVAANEQLVLLMLKCFYELNNEDGAIKAAKILICMQDGPQLKKVNFQSSDITAADCKAIVHVLKHCVEHLDSLTIANSLSFGQYGCLELMKLFDRKEHNTNDEDTPSRSEKDCHLTELNLAFNQITDQGALHLTNALKSKNCHLSGLDLEENQITDQGALHLADALKSGNCQLTKLNLGGNQITNQVVLHLADALKSENCHLTGWNLNL